MSTLDVIPEKRDGLKEIMEEGVFHIVRDKARGASVAMRFLIWARQTPRYHRVDLDDPVGRTVWDLIDGERNVGAIAEGVASRHGADERFRALGKEEIMRLTIRFLRMLYAARLIRYRQ